MYIPVRLPNNAFDLSRATKEMSPPPHAKVPAERKDALAPPSSAPSFPPGLRDVNGELDRLLTRLSSTPSNDGRRSRAELQQGPTEAARATTLTSTAALNRATTSYDKVQLTFGNSTSTAQLSGTYVGTGAAANASKLSVIVESNAAISGTASPVWFRVADQTGATLFSYSGSLKAGDKIDLGSEIGLSISFSEGTLVSDETAFTSVSRTRASDVNVDATFNSTNPNLRPRFENGLAVSAGSFTINGKAIAVKADDSVAAVLRRINEQMPELVATFTDDKVTIASADNARRPIVLGDDSSGFLAATKLLGAAAKAGSTGEAQARLADSAQFAAVRAGSFRMGGATINVDPTVDTLAGVLDRMSQTSPRATAFYDRGADGVSVRGDDEVLQLSDDTSGFLAAIGIDGGAELRVRDGMMLAPGAAARLQRGAADRQAELVNRTLSGLAWASVSDEAVERVSDDEPRGEDKPVDKAATATKARAAYVREREIEPTRERRVTRQSFAVTLHSDGDSAAAEANAATA